ncbi:MAG TPA: xanthine dehydrogenase family protein subunit M [Xanthobacteraceae bacterium]|jgi:carbon-monoxide dehydrogenase medium subunit|nr:xanthine dehydrogenase family protein subunit M [Xanthobacteraceae bacterium]
MIGFELAEPVSLPEAIKLLDADDPQVRPIAGGTALMLMMKAGVFRPARLVSLRALHELSTIAKEADGALKIGAMTSLSALERSALVRQHAPVVVRTLRTLSNVRVRNVATVGGNLAHADPHMDLPPVLIALGAQVVVTGRDGERSIPVEGLFAGYFETVLKRDELITALLVPAQVRSRAAYLKCTTRAVHDWPALGVAVSLDLETSAVRGARIAVSAATEKPLRLPGAEAALVGGAADEAAFRRAADAAAAEAEIIDDAQGSAAYKRQLVRVYVRRALSAALGQTGATH